MIKLILKLFIITSALVQVSCLLGSAGNAKMPLAPLAIVKNKIINSAGEPVLLRGVSIIDPYFLDNERGDLNNKYFENIKRNWKANVIRVPLHAELLDTLGNKYLEKYIDKTIQLATKAGIYVILDYHAIGNPITGETYKPDWKENAPWKGNPYLANLNNALDALEKISKRYGANPGIIFGSFNEPSFINWNDWHKAALKMIDTIQRHAPNSLITVSGIDWGYCIKAVLKTPIKRKNLIYESHPYPWKNAKEWKAVHKELAKQYPIIYGEWGFDPSITFTKKTGSLNGYGKPLVEFANQHGIHWTAWIFDDRWTPKMFIDQANNKLTEFGKLVKNALRE